MRLDRRLRVVGGAHEPVFQLERAGARAAERVRGERVPRLLPPAPAVARVRAAEPARRLRDLLGGREVVPELPRRRARPPSRTTPATATRSTSTIAPDAAERTTHRRPGASRTRSRDSQIPSSAVTPAPTRKATAKTTPSCTRCACVVPSSMSPGSVNAIPATTAPAAMTRRASAASRTRRARARDRGRRRARRCATPQRENVSTTVTTRRRRRARPPTAAARRSRARAAAGDVAEQRERVPVADRRA